MPPNYCCLDPFSNTHILCGGWRELKGRGQDYSEEGLTQLCRHSHPDIATLGGPGGPPHLVDNFRAMPYMDSDDSLLSHPS